MSGQRTRVFVGTPTFTGDLHHKYVSSLMAAQIYCLYHKVDLDLHIVAGASLIQYARNQLVREFLEDEACTHLLWIDADVGFDPTAIMRLLAHDKDVVGGVYPMKTMPVEWPYTQMDGEQTPGLHRAKIMPGGFLLCSRKSMQTVADASSRYVHHIGAEQHDTAHVFDLTLEDRQLLGEDVILCRRLIQAGFDVWCDPDIQFAHCGRFEWRGNLKAAIEQSREQVEPPVVRAAKRTPKLKMAMNKLAAAVGRG